MKRNVLSLGFILSRGHLRVSKRKKVVKSLNLGQITTLLKERKVYLIYQGLSYLCVE